MSKRINLFQVAPDAYKAIRGLEEFMVASGMDRKLYELIKIRASQLNGCAYCLNMHTRDARKAGETEQRINLLNAWRETELYTEKERAALAFTEALTLVASDQVPDGVYDAAAAQFSEKELAALIMGVVAINSWNRTQIATNAPLD